MIIEVYVAILGCLIGSFLNVCIYRIPRRESVAFPPSHCPKCNHKIRWYENIPILSYVVLLRGRCSNCREKISVRYPIVEAMTGAAWLVCYMKFGMGLWTVVSIITVTLLIFGSMVDLDHYYIPNRVSLGIMGMGLIFSLVNGIGIERAILGGAIYGLPFLLIYGYGADIWKREVLGFGDVKLAVALGTLMGYVNLFIVHIFITISFLIGAVVGVTLMLTKKKGRGDEIPFGPYIAIGGMVTLLYFY